LERTESRVNFLQDGIELERLRHAEAEPVREDAGHGLVRGRSVLRDECGLAPRVCGNALREYALRRRDRQPEVDESRVGLVHEHLHLARLRRCGRCRGLLLRLLHRRLRFWGFFGRRDLRGRFLFRLSFCFLRFLFWLAFLGLLFPPVSECPPPAPPGSPRSSGRPSPAYLYA